MKSLRVVGLLVAAGLLTLAGAARAQTCSAGCGMQKKGCLQTARVATLVCKRDCRATAAAANRGACMHGCTDQFRVAKNTCAGDRAACLGLCPPAPPPGSCTSASLDSCGQNLAACARGVVAQAKTCVQGCGTAPDRLGCLQGCAATAQHDAATCAANFAGCVGTCACPGGCDDGNPCTFDTCVNGECRHECLCVGPAGDVTCCPGPGPCPVPSTTTTTIPTGCGTCFDTIGMQCTTEVCSASMPCRLPNEFCSPAGCPAACPPGSTTTTTTTLPGEMCQTDLDCDDGHPCTHDACLNGTCVHECLCVGPAGEVTCCPGPGPCPVPTTTTTTTLPGAACQSDADCNPDGNPCVLAFCAAGVCEQFCRCLQGESFTCSPEQADTCQSVADCAPPLLGDPCRFCIGGLCMGHPFCV